MNKKIYSIIGILVLLNSYFIFSTWQNNRYNSNSIHSEYQSDFISTEFLRDYDNSEAETDFFLLLYFPFEYCGPHIAYESSYLAHVIEHTPEKVFLNNNTLDYNVSTILNLSASAVIENDILNLEANVPIFFLIHRSGLIIDTYISEPADINRSVKFYTTAGTLLSL